MNQGPQFRTFRVDTSSPKGWLSILVLVVIGVVAVALAFLSLIVLLPAGLIAGWFLRRKARKHAQAYAEAGHQPPPRTDGPQDPAGTRVLEADDYKVE